MADPNFGARMLEKMGWKKGTGLGKNNDGIVEPLSVKRKRTNHGIGADNKRPYAGEQWWEKMMREAYGEVEEDKKTDGDLFEACEGRRCRPHGAGKLARLEQHDKSGKSVTKSSKVDNDTDTSTDCDPVSDDSESEERGSEYYLKQAKQAGITLNEKDKKRLKKLDLLLRNTASRKDLKVGKRIARLEDKLKGRIVKKRRRV